MNNARSRTCCFTGHRPQKLPFGYDEEHEDCLLLKMKLVVEIEAMRKNGVTTFVSGMSVGVDIWAAGIALDLKQAYPDAGIRLVAAVPFEEQANRWSEPWRERYFSILKQADETVTLRARYARGCMHERNRYMVDRSAHMIAVFNGHEGGTEYTVNYAIQKGIHAVVLNPDDMTKKEIPPLQDFKLIE